MFEYDVTLAETVDTDTHRISRGLRRRDVALLHALVGQYQYRLVRYFTHLLGQSDPVDDLVQETWLRVLERGASYDGRSRFEPWLFTVARNLAIDHLRKQRIFSLDSNDSPEEDLEPLSPVSHAPSPFDLAARSEDAQHLASSLERLHPIYREVLVLRFQEDLSLQEMASVLRTSVSTVASRIYRGLAALRAHLEEADNAN